jgi:glutamyl-tRNA reductase
VTFRKNPLDTMAIVMALAILHRAPRTGEVPEGAAVWRTCLREVVFLNHAPDSVNATTPVELEDTAYGQLLEIICGLQSPLAGETQVQGQFKTFLAGLDKNVHGELKRVGQRLLADAGEIRDRHLRSLGARSYGSIVRRRTADAARVAIIGTGALADEILPFVTADHAVDQWGRRPERIHDAAVTYRLLADADQAPLLQEPAVLIVAAPLSSEEIARVATQYTTLLRIIDLRSVADATPIPAAVPIVTLDDVFTDESDARAHSATHIDAARAEIVRRSCAYAKREELHPFGWEDLCA